MQKSLGELAPGERGVVVSVEDNSVAIKRRLSAMGLTPGTTVIVKKIAPLGDPIELRLRDYNLSLRKKDALNIIISPLPENTHLLNYAHTTQTRIIEKDTRNHNHQKQEFQKHFGKHYGHLHMHHKYENTRRERLRSGEIGEDIKIALAGNPNSGKSTLFNALTDSNQHVGNWPGVTVEKKEGKTYIDNTAVVVADLPGIYSLSPYSIEERVTRDYIINEQPSAVINIVDATNLERNLYLTLQLMELGCTIVIALNFMDEIEKSGYIIDIERLSDGLGVPVIPISAKKGGNIDELLRLTRDIIDNNTSRSPLSVSERFSALSGDSEAERDNKRYRYIEQIVKASVIKEQKSEKSDKIDRILTHRIFALPIFLLTMLTIFLITFGPVGSYLSEGASIFISDYLTVWAQTPLDAVYAPEWLTRLVCDGIITGVGGVLTFLPQIALLFIFLSLLEDSGYMARGAFIVDRILKHFGLSGKAFIPMLMGFGCTVPAVMGARTMESEKDRKLTIMLIPFMSCSAKLPVYGLIAAAFFEKYAGIAVFALYALGMLGAILSGIILSKTVLKGEAATFVMELPPYRVPMMRNTLIHMWDKVRGFLVRAGTVILFLSVVLWLLQSFTSTFTFTDDPSSSILAMLGGSIAPLFSLCGFGNWQASVALLTGFIAKESIVASMGLFYGFSLSAGSGTITQALSVTFSPLSAFSFLVFVLLYVPCVAAVTTIYREMNSAKWMLFSVVWQICWAYLLSMLVFQIGRFIV